MKSVSNKNNNCLHYVYEHWLDDKLIYIGKGIKDRAFSRDRNKHWKERVGNRVDEVEVVIRGYFERERDAFDYEEIVIIELIQNGVDLTNISNNVNRSPNYSSRYKLLLLKSIKRMMKGSGEEVSSLNIQRDIEIIEMRKIQEFMNLIRNSDRKIIVFTKSIKVVSRMLTNNNCNVLSISSIYNQEASMSSLERYNNLLKKKSIPNDYNVLVLHPYAMGNAKIDDEMIDIVIVDTTSEREYKKAIDSITSPFTTLIKKVSTGEYVPQFELPTEFIDVNLDTNKKNELVEILNIHDMNSRIIKWPTIKKLLKNQGFIIKEKTIKERGKQKRVSIVSTQK